MEGVLVVAVCTKKDYMAVALPEYPLADSCWVSVDTHSTVRILATHLVSFTLSQIKKDYIKEKITHHFPLHCCQSL